MCRYISHSPVPLNNERRFKFAMSTYTWAAIHCDQLWTCVLVKPMIEMIVGRSSEQSTSTRMTQNQPTNQNWPTNQPKKKIT